MGWNSGDTEMAQRSLVVDASVAVKWYSAFGEPGISEAVDIMERHVKGELDLVVPDLLFYEVANALVHKKPLSEEKVKMAISSLFALHMHIAPVHTDLMTLSIKLARHGNITVYDACYAAVAQKFDLPLVTANPRHQGKSLGCKVILIEEWR